MAWDAVPEPMVEYIVPDFFESTLDYDRGGIREIIKLWGLGPSLAHTLPRPVRAAGTAAGHARCQWFRHRDGLSPGPSTVTQRDCGVLPYNRGYRR